MVWLKKIILSIVSDFSLLFLMGPPHFHQKFVLTIKIPPFSGAHQRWKVQQSFIAARGITLVWLCCQYVGKAAIKTTQVVEDLRIFIQERCLLMFFEIEVVL